MALALGSLVKSSLVILRPIQPIPATRPVMVAASRIDFTSLLSDMVGILRVSVIVFTVVVVVVVVFWFDPFDRHQGHGPNYLCSQAVQPPKRLQGRFVYCNHRRSKPSGRNPHKRAFHDLVIHGIL